MATLLICVARAIKSAAVRLDRMSTSGLTPAKSSRYVMVRCNGRLGNQLFQYASALGIAHRLEYGTNACMICSNYDQWTGFRIPPPACPREATAQRIVTRKESGYATYRDFLFPALRADDHLLVETYLQSWRYFDANRTRRELEQRLMFDESVTREARRRVNAKRSSRNTTIVGVHVRRGDKIWNAEDFARTNHPITAFYARSFDYITNRYGNDVVFIVVSDDTAWCERQAVFKSANVFVISTSDPPALDMAILSVTDHRIISVGTFGWWGATLAKRGETLYQDEFVWNDFNKDNVVLRDYYPSQWTNVPCKENITTLHT
ncbi:hypothetical protein CYMTET_22204 [Cymbomonas tetramitiformis]|uniref:L-Fucosyltransferase n=1 Tax=Cymbomonas tetramitiformis TaxID=36881 RepID=A0AAE0L260_9CHLO|nr:hypothetical protein CYMTET_22204 [Cymbomonas tetramitiformis]|eukprot:gene1061-1608_t